MAAVVHDIEASAGDEEAEERTLGQRDVPDGSEEDEMDVEGDHACEDDECLGVELAVASGFEVSLIEVLGDAGLECRMEGGGCDRELRGHRACLLETRGPLDRKDVG